MPFQEYGLWLAVMTMPPAALRWRTSSEIAGVGQGLSVSQTGVPVALMASATAAAKVKSSAMMARQPSVPKRIECMGLEYTRSEIFLNRPEWPVTVSFYDDFLRATSRLCRRPGRGRVDK